MLQKTFTESRQCQRMKIDCFVLRPLCSSGPKVKCTLAVTVSIWSQFPGTSRQEWCCLSTINNNTVKVGGSQIDVMLVLCVFLCPCEHHESASRTKGKGNVFLFKWGKKKKHVWIFQDKQSNMHTRAMMYDYTVWRQHSIKIINSDISFSS